MTYSLVVYVADDGMFCYNGHFVVSVVADEVVISVVVVAVSAEMNLKLNLLGQVHLRNR
jgi:hypothetical protein